MKRLSYTVDNCKYIDFAATGIHDTGFLVDTRQNERQIPFAVKRMYYMYDIPQEQSRGGHAHKDLQQVVLALQGGFSLKLHDGLRSRNVRLEKPGTGLHLVPGIWREVYGFTPNAICMVLASEIYDEADYIRNFQAFLNFRNM